MISTDAQDVTVYACTIAHGLTITWQISPDEMQKLLKAFDDPNPAYASGLHVNGEKYTVITVEPNTIRTKKVFANNHLADIMDND
jgi:hypothetical protein